MVRRPDKELSLEVRPCVGGLQTKFPSALVIPSQTPDALNVLYDRRTIRRRDGCVPINRYLPPRNSLRNRGRKLYSRITGSSANVNAKVVPGYGFIGHRPHFNDYDNGSATALTVSFLTTPEPDGDNYDEQANWFTFNENAGVANTYTYRPILSKGPMRGTRCQAGERTAFSIFVYNGGVNGPLWGAYVQSNIAAAPLLITSAAGDRTNPKPGHTYRITLSVTAAGNHAAGTGQAILSVAELMGNGSVVRNSYTQALTGRIPTNQNPILVFDMPRAQIEAPGASGGLNSATGYWRDSLRYEGRIQDISYWSVDKTANGTDFSFAESQSPLDVTQPQAGLMGHWAPETHTYFDRAPASWEEDKVTIPESRGIDAPMMLGPSAPAWQRSNGKTGLYFDGRTAYAFMPTSVNAASSPLTVAIVVPTATITVVDGARFVDKIGSAIVVGVGTATEESLVIQSVSGNVITLVVATAAAHAIGDYVAVYGSDRNASYVSQGSAVLNAFEAMVQGGPAGESTHTIAITFIPDSLEARNDGGAAEAACQTLFRWSGVVDFGISSRGRPYVTPWQNAGFGATTFVGTTLIPGQRYTFLYARNSDATAEFYVNGRLQASIGGLTAPAVYLSAGGVTPPGLPAFLIGGNENPSTGTSILEDIGATDPDLHFIGRIEDLRIGNQRQLGLSNVDPFLGLSRDLTEDDLYIPTQELMNIDDSAAAGVAARRTFNPGSYLFLHAQGLVQNYTKAPFYSEDLSRILIVNTVNDTTYTLFAAPPGPPIGFDDMRDRKVRASYFLAWWNFEDNTLTEKFETRYRDNRETGATPATYQYYQQDLAVSDKLGFSLPMTLRSREPDVEMIGTALAAIFTWKDTTPQEVKPRIATGLVAALPETNPVTLIAQSITGRGSFTVAAAAASLYWLKPPWQQADSPYPVSTDPDQVSLFASGRIRNHIQIASNSTWDLSDTDRTIEFWMKVPELGVRREIALNWSGGTVDAYNWRVVLTEFGSMHVAGVAGAGFWKMGTVADLTAGDFHAPIVPGQWHHVAITIDVSAIANDRIWIDGAAQPMGTPVGTHAAGWAGGGGAKWIAGHAIELGSPDVTNDDFCEPFFGCLRDFRISTGIRYTANFTRPTTPLTADGTTITLLPLDEGEDLSAGATGSTLARGTIRMEEMLPILDGSLLCSNSSESYPYSWAQHLDTLYLTNGLGPPLALRVRKFAGPRPRTPIPSGGVPRPFGFSVSRMGVTTPGFDIPRLIGQVAVAANAVFTEDDPIQIAVSFLTEDGVESSPQVYDLTVPANGTAGTVGWTRLILDNIPRSLEEHVVARRLYTGTTTPTLVEEEARLGDNLSDETELLAVAGTGDAVTDNKEPPPPSRYIAIHKGIGYMLNQPDAPLDLYISEPTSALTGTTVENFDVPSCIQRLEEGNGAEGTFIHEHLGRLFCGKRDSIFEIQPASLLQGYGRERVNASKGFLAGHSVVAFDNHLFGAMKQGVHVFDAAGIDDISQDLDGLWRTVDRNTPGALGQHGVYHEPTSQYWLTFRRQGERFGREIVVFDKEVQDPSTGRHPWALISTVRHSYMERIESEDGGDPVIYLGTPEGQVMQLLTGQIDGSRQVANPATGTAFTMSGTATAGGGMSLTMASAAFDTLGHGLRGLWCIVTHLDGTVDEVRILGNTGTVLTFETLLPSGASVAVGDTFEIGAYWSYQSSAWLTLTSMSQMKLVRWFDFDFVPNSNSIDFDMVVAAGVQQVVDAFPWASVIAGNHKTVNMALGYHQQPVSWDDVRGYYCRFAIGTRGINKPFEVLGWNFSAEEDGQRKGIGG